MAGQIEGFKIEGLHGFKNFDLHFEDNMIILVGENGSGKTTVLRLLYYLLSGQWRFFMKYQFDKLTLSIDKTKHELPGKFFKKGVRLKDSLLLRRLSPVLRHKIMETVDNEGIKELYEFEELFERFNIPLSYLREEIEDIEVQNPELDSLKKSIRGTLDYQILYLPTFRRIEEELNNIFNWIDDERLKRTRRSRVFPTIKPYVELIEFGMNDVDQAIKNTLEKLKDWARENLNTLTLGYLGDVVDQKYKKVDVNEIQKTSEETIDSVLSRIHQSILSTESKKHLSDIIKSVQSGKPPDEHDEVICHYLLKLLNFQEELRKKEESMSAFCDVCNRYMVDKNFVYDSTEFRFSIISKGSDREKREVELRNLSSGEMQIVSLFSHLYLSEQKKFFVIIDEPELSLSVPWQRRFLTDVKNGGFCSGLVAATHSPFIYDNELKKYAHALGEFTL